MPEESSEMLVRIKPSNNRGTHTSCGYVIKKVDGWVSLPRGVAMALAEERMNDLNPEASPFVFDVMEQEQAIVIEEAENAKVEPAGTADKPRKAIQLPAGSPQAPRQRR